MGGGPGRPAGRDPLTTTVDRAYVGAAVAAAVLAVGQGPRTAAVLGCLLLALVPWVLVAAGRRLPLSGFAVLSVLPLAPVVLLAGVSPAVFLSTAAASRVASRSDRRRLVVAVTAAVVVLPFLAFLAGRGDQGAVYFAFGNLFGVLAGTLVRRAAVLAEDLRVAQRRLEEAAARQERLRIARDVHDLVAHSLTVVVLHVGGARRVLRTDVDAAEAALLEAERVSRESLDGIRGVVGLLRDEREEQRPVVSLDLAGLVATYRTAGLDVALEMTGAVEALPLGVRVTLHRVVQEALANAARHGGPRAVVQVTVAAGALTALVRNDRATVAPAAPAGYGLVGLAEQVAALGGTLTSGAEGDGWVVAYRLPAAAVPTPVRA